MFQFKGAHGCSKASAFCVASPFDMGIEIACAISVTAAGGINGLTGRVGRYIVELPLGKDQLTMTAKGNDDLSDTPVVTLFCCFMGIRQSCE